MSGNHGFPAEFHIRISGLVKGCKQWELCVYLYFGGTLPGHGERKTLEVSLQTQVFRLPAPSHARAALWAAALGPARRILERLWKSRVLDLTQPGRMQGGCRLCPCLTVACSQVRSLISDRYFLPFRRGRGGGRKADRRYSG